MSVIVKEKNNHKFSFFMKGSVEMILKFCAKDSLPENFEKIVNFYSKQGYRIIMCAKKELNYSLKEILNFERNKFEKDLIALGIIIFENKLKEETIQTISELKNADVKTLMITGDNILTSINVGIECKIIEERNKLFLAVMNKDNNEMNFTSFESLFFLHFKF